jgi:TolB-like protein
LDKKKHGMSILDKGHGYMKRNIRIPLSFIALLLLIPLCTYSQEKAPASQKTPAIQGVAVVNFTNNTGKKSLQNLSSSLPESVSGSLAQIKGIRLVERQNMGKLLNEVELQMSGMFDPDQTVKIGKMTKADILIIGSYGGSESNIILTLKAVDVATGHVLDGKVVQAPVTLIYDSASQAAISMAAVISGSNVGYLSVSSNPDGADVYVDGMNIGRSPVVDIRVPAGSHKVSVVKENCIGVDASINVGVNAHEEWTPTLPSKAMLNRTEWAVAAYANIPFSSKIQVSPLFAVSTGKTFEHIYLGGEIASGWIEHDQNLQTAFGTLDHERLYVPVLAGLHLNFIPFTSWRYFSPYAGIFAQCGFMKNYEKENGSFVDDPKTATSFIYGFGPTFGINFLPFSKFSLFVEARVAWYPVTVDRYEYVPQPGFGGAPSLVKHNVNLSSAMIGGGFMYYFD